MSDVSLGIAFVVLEVLIATFPHPPPPPFKVILQDNYLSAGAIIRVGDCKRGGPRGSIEIETPSILQTQAGTRVFPQILCGEEMDDRFATFFELSNFPSASYLGRQCMHSVSISQQWRIQGRAGGPGPPLISKPNWDPKGRENNYVKVWMTVPPPLYLKDGHWPVLY